MKSEKAHIPSEGQLCLTWVDTLHIRENSGSCLPRHRVSVPLQRPDRRHSLTVDPVKTKPRLQLKMADAPKVVCVPIFFPLGGVGRSPQEMTARERKRDKKGGRWNKPENKRETVLFENRLFFYTDPTDIRVIKQWPVLFHGENNEYLSSCRLVFSHFTGYFVP